MISHPVDPGLRQIKIPIIAHDVGRSHDRSTAVIGGHFSFFSGPRVLEAREFRELPIGIYGSQLANELAGLDHQLNHNCLIVADLSNDWAYGEILSDTFGRRVIGVQIGRSGDGMTWKHLRAKNGAMPVYNVGRSFLLELLLAELRNHHIRLQDSPESRRTCAQLNALEPEQRETGIIYKCPQGSMTISLCRLPCLPGRHSTCILMLGSSQSSMRTGPGGRSKNSAGPRSSNNP
jgi:hypothetical protein